MKWSYYCVKPDADSIRVYIYSQYNDCYFRVFEREKFDKRNFNAEENLGDKRFTFDVLCRNLESDDIHFELEQESEKMIMVHFMYRVLYSDYTSVEWVMKMYRLVERDEYVRPVLRNNNIYRVSHPEDIFVYNKGDLSRDIIRFDCQYELTDYSNAYVYYYQVKFLDGHILIEFIYTREKILYLYIDQEYCEFVVSIYKQIYVYDEKYVRGGSKTQDTFLKEKIKNKKILIENILKYVYGSIKLEDLSEVFEKLKIYHIHNYDFLKFKLENLFLKQFYDIIDNHFGRDRLFYNFQNPVSDVRYTYETFPESSYQPAMIPFPEYLRLYKKNVSDKVFSENAFDILIRHFERFKISSDIKRHSVVYNIINFKNIFQKRKFKIIHADVSDVKTDKYDNLWYFIKSEPTRMDVSGHETYLLVWE